MQLGLEVFLSDSKLIKNLKNKRIGLVCHPASVDKELNHSLDLLHGKLKLSCAFGPQHGAKGDKQDNMIETDDVIDSKYQIPIFSLYGKVRRPTQEMMQTFDVLLYDLQDLGCRIYTFITTLLYIMEECEKHNKTLIILDRPNPIGRPVEGLILEKGFESFVGAAEIPMRYGLTSGELALWFKERFHLNLDLKIIKMKNYSIKKNGGWPTSELSWLNPSPNAQTLSMARCYPGTVMIEGTHLSEGRGTTRALEQVGAHELNFEEIIKEMYKLSPKWLKGCKIRPCYFEPTFHKYEKKLCHGMQIHVDNEMYIHDQFKPYRIISLMLKVISLKYPDFQIFRDFPYEYVTDKLAFDVINGGTFLRNWIEDSNALVGDLEKKLVNDEKSWIRNYKKYFLYK